MLHGVADGKVRFGVATWFHDVLVRFGYDLPENEHPWDGEWIDDAFEAAALDLRATGSKLLRVLDRLDGTIDAEQTPLWIDLAVAYLDRVQRAVAVAVPCCYGREGRALEAVRYDGLAAVAGALHALDPAAAGALCPPDALRSAWRLASHEPTLFGVIDAAGAKPALPRSLDRARAASAEVTAGAVAGLDGLLAVACPWLDGVLTALQRAIGARAEDGEELLERWASPDWAVVRPATPVLASHLPHEGSPAGP